MGSGVAITKLLAVIKKEMGPLSTHLSSITQFPSFRVWYVIFILKEKGLRERNRYPGEF